MSGIFSGIIRLRRDNDYNYDKIKNTFIPANGEVCLIDTSTNGLRAKVGDGITIFANLPYSDENILTQINGIIVRGYYKDGNFYADPTGQNLVEASVSKLYIDIPQSKIYTYNGVRYETLGGDIPNATADTFGVMKLYNTTGQNIDGTMTQKAITDELDDKIEMSVNVNEEMIIFGTDIN